MQNVTFSQMVKTKEQFAYENIKAAISKGDYKPGEKLVLNMISKKLGMSNIPVREALKKLESEGYVKNTPHFGSIVAEPDFKNYAEIFVVRQLLEGQATFFSAQNMPPNVMKKIKKTIEEMKSATDPIRVAELDQQFHDLIFASCGNATLCRLIQQLRLLSPRSKFIFSLAPSIIAKSVKDHEELYSLLEAKNPEAAKEAFLSHKQRGYDLLMRYAELAQ